VENRQVFARSRHLQHGSVRHNITTNKIEGVKDKRIRKWLREITGAF